MSELESFHRFLGDQLAHGTSTRTPEECLELWREQNPPNDEVEVDTEAIREALDDMEAGDRGQPLQEFLAEFRARETNPHRNELAGEDEALSMACWIFKCNPKKYRLADRLADPNPTITWIVSLYRDQIGPGDTIFIWETGPGRGIRAVLRAEATPQDMHELESEQPYFVERDTDFRCRVLATILNHDINLPHSILRSVPGLENLPVFSGFQQRSNFHVTPAEGRILQRLVAGRPAVESVAVRLPEEMPEGAIYSEGGVQQILVNRYERDPRAREACIARFGTICYVCRFDFVSRYGQVMAGFIHVHHLKPLASAGVSDEVDPERDLRPVCPNCHAVIHRREPPYSIEEVQEFIRGN